MGSLSGAHLEARWHGVDDAADCLSMNQKEDEDSSQSPPFVKGLREASGLPVRLSGA